MKVLFGMLAFVASIILLYEIDPTIAFFVLFIVVIYAIHDSWF